MNNKNYIVKDVIGKYHEVNSKTEFLNLVLIHLEFKTTSDNKRMYLKYMTTWGTNKYPIPTSFYITIDPLALNCMSIEEAKIKLQNKLADELIVAKYKFI